MSAITLTEAQEQLANWLAAERALANGGQAYAIGNRSLTRADGQFIAERITYWRGEVARLTAVANGNTQGGVLTAGWF